MVSNGMHLIWQHVCFSAPVSHATFKQGLASNDAISLELYVQEGALA